MVEFTTELFQQGSKFFQIRFVSFKCKPFGDALFVFI